jgi:alpha-methylacyl-CoA racemase
MANACTLDSTPLPRPLRRESTKSGLRSSGPPRDGVGRSGAKPLAGVRVVTLALNVPGPVAAARLRELGADVIKIEPPTGDPLSRLSPAWYELLQVGQRVVPLNLKDAADRARLDALLEKADLLLTSQRPAALERLSLGWAEVHVRVPHVAQVAIVGYTGSRRDRSGHDLTYLAPLGLVVPPALPRTLIVDLAGAERAVVTALALLYAHERGQTAGYEEVALSEVARSFAAPLRVGLTAPGGPLGGAFPAYGLYPAREGWVAIGALEERFQQRLLNNLGLQELTEEALAQAFSTRTAQEWETWAIERDLPLAAARSCDRESGTDRPHD